MGNMKIFAKKYYEKIKKSIDKVKNV